MLAKWFIETWKSTEQPSQVLALVALIVAAIGLVVWGR
jgi:hypothetical protein